MEHPTKHAGGKPKSTPRKTNKQQLHHSPLTSSHQQLRTTSPPFKLYADDTRPSFTEGWASVVKLLKGRKNIAILAGAGISVSCGIPDFRSKESGLYSTLDTISLGLSCPEDLFDSHFFQEDPRPFYKFARQLYFPLGTGEDEEHPRRIRPSDSHKLLALLEQKKLLLRVYSQNIDGLEEEAGVSARKVCYAHGSLQWATCCVCKRKVAAKEIESSILAGTVPYCQAPAVVTSPPTVASREPSARAAASRKRNRSTAGDDSGGTPVRSSDPAVCGGIMKPGVTFFGEALHNTVKSKLESDRGKVDALIVIGTSLSVAPISKVIDFLPKNIPRILINRGIVHPPDQKEEDEGEGSGRNDGYCSRENYVFDAYLLGYCDIVTQELSKSLFSNSDIASPVNPLKTDLQVGELLADALRSSESTHSAAKWLSAGVPTNRVFLFPGAEPPTGVWEEASFREIAHCDGCSKRIEGTIQKCTICFDYDLCQECFPLLHTTHFDGLHHFIVEPVEPAP